MIGYLESSTVLRQRLGRHLARISELDPLPRERRRTAVLREKLLQQYGAQCGYCLQACEPDGVDAAHIIPLEIGARTVDENLVLLCKECHRFYDAGHVSIQFMRVVAADWRKRSRPGEARPALDIVPAIGSTITPPPRSLQDTLEAVLEMQRHRKYAKAAALLNDRLNDFRTSGEARVYLLIKRAELTRRRSAQGAVGRALDLLKEMNRRDVPPKYRPAFFYELSYTHRLLGHHVEAARWMHESAEATRTLARSGLPEADYVAALANEILCELAGVDTLGKREAEGFAERFAQLEGIARKHGEYWGGRWALNCAVHALQAYAKARDATESWRALDRVRDAYFSSNVGTGWDAAARQSISLVEGLVRVLFPQSDGDLDSGIGLLARSFVTRLGPRQRPEGIRDAGFGLAIGLRKREHSLQRTAEVIESLMERTVDGTSVIWPWQASAALPNHSTQRLRWKDARR